ncbi:sensor histidine kinase [Paenibacillus eucommiae]|uniref:histidine kinase n=1 Tax=Paenibacillus eucommiae TaxID=1355755 RepID=A0ABS4IWL4_9BACL|nr:sensor histidine kinase [Paenibacillus eucommiae]MBP1991985.1 two-component system sensor histidine kinase YesM [Paenibacillus eucommiae]
MIRSIIANFKSSLQNKLLFSYSLVIVIPLVFLGSILYVSAISITKTQTQENRLLEMKLLSEQLQEYFNSLELYSRAIYTGEIQGLLNSGLPDDIIDQTRWKSSLFQQFSEWYGYMGIRGDIHNVTIVTSDGAMIQRDPLYVEENFSDEIWYQQALKLKGEVYVAGPFERTYFIPPSTASPYVFSLVRKINNTTGRADLGGIVIDVSVMDIYRLLNELNLKDMIILNADNQIVYSSAIDKIGQQWMDGEKIKGNTSAWMDINNQRMFVSSTYSDATGWRFVSLDPLSSIQSNSNKYRNITIGIGFIALIIAMIISTFVSRRITKPLRTLQQKMKKVQSGDFNIQLDVQSTDEVGQLTQSFNRMTEEIHTLVNHVYKSEIIQKEAQLKALHSQINPHFLYNTLDSINAIAVIEDVPVLARMTKMLSDMFRYSISTGEQIVPLEEELKQVVRYVEIQQIRYDNKFSLIVNIPDYLLSYPIPKLTLQPIVENAIYHGLEMLPGEGHITINGYETATQMILKVSDNGPGIPEPVLLNIQSNLQGKAPNVDHIGLANVQERIELHFGSDYGIKLESKLGEGTTVTYILPKTKNN